MPEVHRLVLTLAAWVVLTAGIAGTSAGPAGPFQSSEPLPEQEFSAREGDQSDPCQPWMPLHRAVFDGDIERVMQLLASGADANARTPEGSTPIHLAVSQGITDVDMYEALVRFGADVDAVDGKGKIAAFRALRSDRLIRILADLGADFEIQDRQRMTPLMLAAATCKLEVVQALVEGGADVQARSGDGRTVIQHAPVNRDKRVLKYLLERVPQSETRSDDGQTTLFFAATNGSPEQVRLLIEKGADVNAVDDHKMTPLMSALAMGKPRNAEALLEAGARIDATDGEGRTTLHCAANGNDAGCIDLILKEGIPLEVRTRDGRTPLMEAATLGAADSAEAFLERGADVHATNNSGETPLLLAVQSMSDRLEVVEVLLRAGARIDVRDRGGLGVMHHYCKWGPYKPQQLDVLLRERIDLNARDSAGSTALMHAARAQRDPRDLLTRLVQLGMDVNAAGADGQTPLMTAVGCHLAETTTPTLLDLGADVGRRDQKGRTAVQYAGAAGRFAIMRRLFDVIVNTGDPEAVQTAAAEALYWAVKNVDAENARVYLAAIEADDQPNYLGSLLTGFVGSVGSVRLLLDLGADPNAADSEGDRALSRASRNTLAEIASILLKAGADPNAGGRYGSHPLHEACSQAFAKAVSVNPDAKAVAALTSARRGIIIMLLDAGADVNGRDDGGNTPLMAHGDREGADALATTRLLIERGADVNARNERGKTPLMIAASGMGDDPGILAQLIEAGADPSAVDQLGHDALYYTVERSRIAGMRFLLTLMANDAERRAAATRVLAEACFRVDPRIGSELLDFGADPNGAPDGPTRPLIGASVQGHETLVRRLIELGAQVNGRDASGRTALMLSLEREHDSVTQILLAHGADINARMNDGWTLLHHACQRHDSAPTTKLIEALIQAGADLNVETLQPQTPIEMALEVRNLSALRMLARAGANLEHRNRFGKTPLMTAAMRGDAEAVRILCEYDADINAVDEDGRTPLMLAVAHPYQAGFLRRDNGTDPAIEVVKELLRRGVDVERRDRSGRRAVDLVSKDIAAERRESIVRLLSPAPAPPP